MCVFAFGPKAGAQCVSSARWDLCGGPLARAVPTAIRHASTLLSRMARGSCRAAETVKAVSTVAGRAGGPARSSYEAPAGRGGGGAKGPGHPWCVRSINRECVSGRSWVDKLKPSGKSFDISKWEVWEAYRQVKANRGAPGVDGVTLEEFDKDLKHNRYKICGSRRVRPPPATRQFRRQQPLSPKVLNPLCTNRFVESHARLHLAVGLTSAFVIVSRPLHQLLSHEPVQFLRIRRMPTPLDLSAEILAIAVWTTASSTRRWPPISSTRRMRR